MFIGLLNDPLGLKGLSLDEVECEVREKAAEAVVKIPYIHMKMLR
jgi:hypothetical protein